MLLRHSKAKNPELTHICVLFITRASCGRPESKHADRFSSSSSSFGLQICNWPLMRMRSLPLKFVGAQIYETCRGGRVVPYTHNLLDLESFIRTAYFSYTWSVHAKTKKCKGNISTKKNPKLLPDFQFSICYANILHVRVKIAQQTTNGVPLTKFLQIFTPFTVLPPHTRSPS